MPKTEKPLQQLSEYIPEGSFEPVLEYLVHYRVHLTVTSHRKTVLGDYRHAHQGKPHRISVNGNLNPYAFLVTLLHELAHLLTYERYGHRVQAHGREWKTCFGKLLDDFLSRQIFPEDIRNALAQSLHNPAASSCGDEVLMRVLRNYDRKKEHHVLVEQIRDGEIFAIRGGRIFRRHQLVRKRIRCEELETGKIYLFSPVYEVVRLEGRV